MKTRSPWLYIPSLYFLEGLPYILINVVSGALYTKMGVPNDVFVFWTGFLYLPWTLKMFWSPLVDGYSTKRRWLLWGQFLAAAIFYSPSNYYKIPRKDNTPFEYCLSVIYILNIPKASRTDDTSIRTMHIGAIYLITTSNRAFLLNLPESSTSCEIASVLITYPTNTHVKKATMGISTLLLIKSKKSRN